MWTWVPPAPQKKDGRGMGRNSLGPKQRGKEALLDEISPSSRKTKALGRVSAQGTAPRVNQRVNKGTQVREGPGKERLRQTREYLRKGLCLKMHQDALYPEMTFPPVLPATLPFSYRTSQFTCLRRPDYLCYLGQMEA